MCFSAEASFISGTILAAAGVASLCLVKNRKQIFFASIPLLFSLHQLSEGFLRLALTHTMWMEYSSWFMYIFLFFSQVLRVFWIPLSISLLEHHGFQKKILRVLIGIGGIVSIYLLYCLFTYPVSAEIVDGHIYYLLKFPLELKLFIGILYGLAIVLSPLISSNRRVRLLGGALFLSLIITKLLYAQYLISVWCFFAALLSVLVMYVLDEHIWRKVKRFFYKGNATSLS